MAKKILASNEDVTVEMESNFDLDEWSSYFDERLTTKFLTKARQTILQVVRERFKSGIGPHGIPWAPLSQLTIAKKLGKGKILAFSNKLRESIKGSIYATELIVSTPHRYAFALQYGYSKPTTPKQSLWMWHNLYEKKGHPFRAKKITLPARPFLGFDSMLNSRLNVVLKDLILKSEKLGKYDLK